MAFTNKLVSTYYSLNNVIRNNIKLVIDIELYKG